VDAATFHLSWRGDAGTRALRGALAPRGEVLVGYVGRLAPEKELHRLAPLAGLAGTRVVVVGDGPSRLDDQALLAAAGLDVVFLGRRDGDDLARAYAALDVFVHTGTRETFGQTLQEAAASGLPVVAPARGGPIDLVDHSRTGLLFDPDSPDGLRDAVAHLAGDRAKRQALGRAGRTRVAHRSWAGVTDELLGHYAAVRTSRTAAR
jgi:phosphatidylinositol alpha 1,6-mannosyltransferase